MSLDVEEYVEFLQDPDVDGVALLLSYETEEVAAYQTLGPTVDTEQFLIMVTNMVQEWADGMNMDVESFLRTVKDVTDVMIEVE